MVKCEICGKNYKRITGTHLKKHSMTVSEYVEKFGNNLFDEYLRDAYRSATLESHIRKYGEKDGKIKWDEYRARQAYTNTFEYKHKTYGMNETEFNEYNKGRAVTKELCIKRHGDHMGTLLWNSYVEKQRLTKNKDYVVNKYGEEAWNRLCKSKGVTINNFQNKYGDENGSEKFAEYLSKYSEYSFNTTSEIAKSFYNDLESAITTVIEYEKPVICENKRYFVDIYLPLENKAIEFYGDYWHGNPKMFLDDANIRLIKNTYITAKQRHTDDANRVNAINKSLGCKTLVVWEQDYKENKALIIQEVVKWIMN